MPTRPLTELGKKLHRIMISARPYSECARDAIKLIEELQKKDAPPTPVPPIKRYDLKIVPRFGRVGNMYLSSNGTVEIFLLAVLAEEPLYTQWLAWSRRKNANGVPQEGEISEIRLAEGSGWRKVMDGPFPIGSQWGSRGNPSPDTWMEIRGNRLIADIIWHKKGDKDIILDAVKPQMVLMGNAPIDPPSNEELLKQFREKVYEVLDDANVMGNPLNHPNDWQKYRNEAINKIVEMTNQFDKEHPNLRVQKES